MGQNGTAQNFRPVQVSNIRVSMNLSEVQAIYPFKNLYQKI